MVAQSQNAATTSAALKRLVGEWQWTEPLSAEKRLLIFTPDGKVLSLSRKGTAEFQCPAGSHLLVR